jgi:hypothetical protein
VAFVAPSQDDSAPSLNVVVMAAAPGETLDKARQQINELLPRMSTDYQLISQGSTTLGGVEAFYNTSTHTSGTPPQVSRMHQVYVLRNNRAYTFTCGALDARYADLESAFTASLKSVVWR